MSSFNVTVLRDDNEDYIVSYDAPQAPSIGEKVTYFHRHEDGKTRHKTWRVADIEWDIRDTGGDKTPRLVFVVAYVTPA